MGLMLSVNKSDLAKSIPIPEGWKKFKLSAFNAKPSKTVVGKDASMNYVYTCQLIGDPNNREIDHYFNSKALGFMAPFLAALKNCTIQEMLDSINSDSFSFDAESVLEKEIMGKVKHDVYNGSITCKIEEWASPDKLPF